ncbi:MAG TPA: ATP synthase F1 subunit delta [Candidatus Margulisiibacteriota bacterium]|nr:ATP synthase F1 subunit delta [Candidatus Margulisiibacteriota bacterium]
MIKNRALASRYARAFIEYCSGTIGTEEALSALKKVRQFLDENEQLREALENPAIAYSDKYGIVEEVFAEEFTPEIRYFLKTLVENGRFAYISDIIEFARIKYAHGGREEALIKTSYLLDLELIKQIQDALQKKFGKEFKFYVELDGSLLGGVQVIIGNTVIDGSVRKRLDDLKQKLVNTQVN